MGVYGEKLSRKTELRIDVGRIYFDSHCSIQIAEKLYKS